jgi:hypothetical protein
MRRNITNDSFCIVAEDPMRGSDRAGPIFLCLTF